jgi:hypothetical protein
MLGSWPTHELPNLTDENCDVTSAETRRYNCIAWAAGNDRRWWWPDDQNIGYWPDGAPREDTVDAFMQTFAMMGYELCLDSSLQPGLEKIAIYGIRNADGSTTPTHASIQLSSGRWSSKIGPFEDITHPNADTVNGPVYGRVVCYMARKHRTAVEP